jgi:tRNA pseudouridine(55) synthase
MKLIYKNLGETPLEALEKLRQSEPALKEETLSYIGRLDPMAEGEMIVLVGKEENQKRDEYLNFDKEYMAEFLIGFATDTGDLLGLVQKTSNEKISTDFLNNEILSLDSWQNLSEKISTLPEKLLQIIEQKFPWFSSKHVFGRALFDWFKAGQQEEIERPSKQIKIYSAELIKSAENIFFRKITAGELQNYLTQNINKVKGDFRQSEILERWQGILQTADSPTTNFPISEFLIFTLKLKVSTGTYIRGLTEEIEKEIGQPVVLFSLKRSKIHLN